jgi:hypothetical protein
MLTKADLSNATWIEPSEWMKESLRRLCVATGYKGAVGLAVLQGEWPNRIGVTNNPDGGLWRPHNPAMPYVILLPERAEESDKWKTVICHEFVHLLMSPVDEYVDSLLSDQQREQYKLRVEAAMKPLMLIAMITQVVNVEWIEDEEGGSDGRHR